MSDQCSLDALNTATDGADFEVLRILLCCVHCLLLVAALVLMLKYMLPRLRGSYPVLRDVIRGRTGDQAGEKDGVWARSDSVNERKIQEYFNELRVHFLYSSGPLLVFMMTVFSLAAMLANVQAAQEEDSASARRGLRSQMWLQYGNLVPLNIAISAMMLVISRPRIASPSRLDTMNVAFCLCVYFTLAFWLPRSVAVRPTCFLIFTIQGVQGLLCGNAKLSTSLLFGATVIVWLNCPELGTLEEAFWRAGTQTAFCWVTEVAFGAFARLKLREADAMMSVSVIERLLARTCDACVFLGPRLEIVRGADQLGNLLMHKGSPQALLGRVITDLAPESERAKIAELFAGASEEDDLEREGRTGFLSVSLRDSAGLLVRVQVTHACLGVGDARVHVVGIREEQEEGGQYDVQGADMLEVRLARDASDWESSSSETSSVGQDIEDADHAPETEIHVSFNAFDGGEDEDFPISSCSPAFKALMRLRDPDPERGVFMGEVFRWDKQFEKFEQWATNVVKWDADGESPPWFKWLVFPLPGCRSAGMWARCSITFQDEQKTIMLMTLHDVQWFSTRRQEDAPKKAKKKKKDRPRMSGSGTPRSQDSGSSLRSSKESTHSL